MPKFGRPKKPSKEQVRSPLRGLVTREEERTILEAVSLVGGSRSEFVRRVAVKEAREILERSKVVAG